MARYSLEVCSQPHVGRESEYIAWYTGTHLGEVIALPGFVSGVFRRRLHVGGSATGEFVALYQVECDDPAALIASLYAALPSMNMSDAIDTASARMSFLTNEGL